MSTFAEDLSKRILGESGFWNDFERVSSAAVRRLIPGLQRTDAISKSSFDAAIDRLLESAFAFVQTESDANRSFAQDIAFFSALVSEQEKRKEVAREIVCRLGNIPGADRFSADLKVVDSSFLSYLRQHLLKALNTVSIGGENYALTDFQRSVWAKLQDSDPSAETAKKWLEGLTGKEFQMSRVIWAELERKAFVKLAA